MHCNSLPTSPVCVGSSCGGYLLFTTRTMQAEEAEDNLVELEYSGNSSYCVHYGTSQLCTISIQTRRPVEGKSSEN